MNTRNSKTITESVKAFQFYSDHFMILVLSSWNGLSSETVSWILYFFFCGTVLQTILLWTRVQKLNGQFHRLIVPSTLRCLVPLTKARKVTWQVEEFSLCITFSCSVFSSNFSWYCLVQHKQTNRTYFITLITVLLRWAGKSHWKNQSSIYCLTVSTIILVTIYGLGQCADMQTNSCC